MNTTRTKYTIIILYTTHKIAQTPQYNIYSVLKKKKVKYIHFHKHYIDLCVCIYIYTLAIIIRQLV